MGTTLKWRRINVDATWSRRIDVDMTSFWYCVPAGQGCVQMSKASRLFCYGSLLLLALVIRYRDPGQNIRYDWLSELCLVVTSFLHSRKPSLFWKGVYSPFKVDTYLEGKQKYLESCLPRKDIHAPEGPFLPGPVGLNWSLNLTDKEITKCVEQFGKLCNALS